MRTYLIAILIIVLIVIFFYPRNVEYDKKYKIPEIKKIPNTALFERDKQQIAECYISNVEYYRLSPDKIENSVIFEPYSCYYGGEGLGYVKLPTTSDKNIDVKVGDIYYNPDKLISVIFIGVKQTIDLPNIEKRRKGREYDAMCLIGLRNDTLEGFTLYPFRAFKQTGYSDYETPLRLVKEPYFTQLADAEAMWGKKYRTNLGDKDFWINNLLFDKVKTEEGEILYYFQTYSLSDLDGKHWDNHHKYDVVSCD